MDIDVEGRCGAGYDEKSAERTNSCNGFREPRSTLRSSRREHVGRRTGAPPETAWVLKRATAVRAVRRPFRHA